MIVFKIIWIFSLRITAVSIFHVMLLRWLLLVRRCLCWKRGYMLLIYFIVFCVVSLLIDQFLIVIWRSLMVVVNLFCRKLWLFLLWRQNLLLLLMLVLIGKLIVIKILLLLIVLHMVLFILLYDKWCNVYVRIHLCLILLLVYIQFLMN